ncbi:MAG: L-threonylcarbamoyladenylate synthase [bacterium]
MSFFSQKQLDEYCEKLKNGAVIAFPTDTVWGIGCLPDNKTTCQKIYSIKKRDGKKPLILLGENMDDFSPYIKDFPPIAKKLADKYWPGALTIIVKKSPLLSDDISSGMDSIGLRIPNHPVLLELLQHTGPLATTSANLSGEPPAINFEQTQDYVGSEVDFIINDFTIASQGIESTVIIIDNDKYKVLRQGAINLQE